MAYDVEDCYETDNTDFNVLGNHQFVVKGCYYSLDGEIVTFGVDIKGRCFLHIGEELRQVSKAALRAKIEEDGQMTRSIKKHL